MTNAAGSVGRGLTNQITPSAMTTRRDADPTTHLKR